MTLWDGKINSHNEWDKLREIIVGTAGDDILVGSAGDRARTGMGGLWSPLAGAHGDLHADLHA